MKGIKKECLFKIVIIGDPSTGKTSLLSRYCENTFKEEYKITVGVDFQVKILKMKDQRIVKLQIWDTAGQERFKVMTKSYYRSARACLIVYDITRKETFENVRDWAKQYNDSNIESKQGNGLILILGNKKDLSNKREVPTNEGNLLAQEFGCDFQEVSAKEGGDDIADIFFSLAEKLMQNEDLRKPEPEQPKPSIIITSADSKKKKKDGCCK